MTKDIQSNKQIVNVVVNNNTDNKKKYTKRKKNNPQKPSYREILQDNPPQVSYNPSILPYNRTPNYGMKSINPILNNESVVSNILNNRFNNRDNINYEGFFNPTVRTQIPTPTPTTVAPIALPLTIPTAPQTAPQRPPPPPPPPPPQVDNITTFNIQRPPLPPPPPPFFRETGQPPPIVKEGMRGVMDELKQRLQNREERQTNPQLVYEDMPSAAHKPLQNNNTTSSQKQLFKNVNDFIIPDPNKIKEQNNENKVEDDEEEDEDEDEYKYEVATIIEKKKEDLNVAFGSIPQVNNNKGPGAPRIYKKTKEQIERGINYLKNKDNYTYQDAEEIDILEARLKNGDYKSKRNKNMEV